MIDELMTPPRAAGIVWGRGSWRAVVNGCGFLVGSKDPKNDCRIIDLFGQLVVFKHPILVISTIFGT